MLTGNDPTGGVKAVHKNEMKSVTSNKISLDKTPVGAITTIYKLNPDGTNGTEYTFGTPATNPTEYSLAAKEITFHSTVLDGTKFRIYYKANTDTTATTIKLTSDKFGGTFKVVLDVLVRLNKAA